MSKFAVGFINFFDNELEIEIIEANNWREASIKHSSSMWDSLTEIDREDSEDPEDAENETFSVIPETLQEAKNVAFELEGAFDCVEIK